MIKKTENLEMFKKHPLNRDLEESNVVRIMGSIRIKNLLEKRPILINEKMEIIDGQHRLEACKRLGIPIFYEMEKALECQDIILLNANQKSWKFMDFINYHARNGNKNYIDLLSFSESIKLNPHVTIRLFGRPGGFYDAVKKGNFKMPAPDSEKVTKIKRIITSHQDVIALLDLKVLGDKKYINGQKFQTVLLEFLCIELLNIDVFMKKIQQRIDLICQRSTTTAYYAMWREIYNYRNQDPLP